MSLFYYWCGVCSKHMGFLGKSQTEEATITRSCPTCGTLLQREPKLVTSKTVEVLDNGYMTRPVERPGNFEEIKQTQKGWK